MRSFLALAAPGVVAMLLQTVVFPALPYLPVRPDLILVLAGYLGVRHHNAGGALGAFTLGYFLDTFSGTILGMQTFAISAAYVAMTIMARHLWMERGLPLMATVFVGGCVQGLAAVAVAALVATRAPVWQHVVRYGFLEAAAAALVAPAVFRCVTWEKRLLGLG
ncbi:MAG: rod shape-determining protein MreD [Deltaproteobacteria bacterium]|nr:MAG: rod shape-determining protein MreD [Deltaproteobacteria bacterium]